MSAKRVVMLVARRFSILVLSFLAVMILSTNVRGQAPSPCSPGFVWDAKSKKCVSCVKPCETGLPGACGRGVMNCDVTTPQCEVVVKPGERMEICNGEDDDCDGVVDEGYDKDQDRYTTCGGDCDDRNPLVHPDVAELCDGRDNNCNGVIDDGFNVGSICTVGRGICVRKGRLRCAEDQANSICDATPGEPGQELCDGLDNDCDGMIDNGLGELTCGLGACRVTVAACVQGKLNKCAPLKPEAELCGDKIDNDCDGKADEDFEKIGLACRVGKGICEREGIFVCAPDMLSLACNVEPGKAQEEICGNRLDDDCNGIVDDAAGLGEPCDNQLLGECRRTGQTICDATKGMVVCSAPQVKPQKEVCDEKDNNCDGTVDEGVKNACGTCSVLTAEVGSACQLSATDLCAAGVWECDEKEPGQLKCSPRFAQTEGEFCLDDGNPCTKDFCQAGACVHPQLTDGTACDDENACTVADHCENGFCRGGAYLTCNDGNPCTEDKCDVVLGCVYDEIGGGRPNQCGGCDILKMAEGEKCDLKHLSGICTKGEYRCTPDQEMACVQTVFPYAEICNDADDDCDGLVDEELGEITCGIGACKVTIARCARGRLQTCTPAESSVETCDNMGVDNDCNGAMDDIAGLGANCPVKIGTCIIPGVFQCEKGRKDPVCLVAQAGHEKDDDHDGVPNYCERELEGTTLALREAASGTGLFNRKKTRSAMLPWTEVFDAVVSSKDSKDAWLLISGKGPIKGGIAATAVEDIFKEGPIRFNVCNVGAAPELKNLVVTAGGDLFASSEHEYYYLPNVRASLSSSSGHCRLAAEAVFRSETRPWSGDSQDNCAVKDILSMTRGPGAEEVIAAAVLCDLSSRDKNRQGLGLDIISFKPQSKEQRFIPLWDTKKSVDAAVVLPIADEDGPSFAVLAMVGEETKTAWCAQASKGWECVQGALTDIKKPLLPLTRHTTGEPILLATTNGAVFQLIFSKDNLKVKQKGAIEEARQAVTGGALLPVGQGGAVILGREYALSAILPPAGDKFWSKAHSQNYLPESIIDEIVSGKEMAFVNPHAITPITVKGFGGSDLFAAFDISGGGKKIGTMGFFFWNENQPPYGSLTDINFDGKRGTAVININDADGDELKFDVHIRARHGGSLDHWIDGVKDHFIRFSSKGETASTVGVWPIKLSVEALDPEGRGVISSAVLAQDGTVESIQELAR